MKTIRLLNNDWTLKISNYFCTDKMFLSFTDENGRVITPTVEAKNHGDYPFGCAFLDDVDYSDFVEALVRAGLARPHIIDGKNVTSKSFETDTECTLYQFDMNVLEELSPQNFDSYKWYFFEFKDSINPTVTEADLRNLWPDEVTQWVDMLNYADEEKALSELHEKEFDIFENIDYRWEEE